MHILTHILLICLWLDVVWAQASAPGPSPAQKTNNEDLSELALWPDVDIRGLLAGETNATEKTPSPVDLLFVLQADSATLVPASDGGLLGGHLLLGGVLSQVVAFADRPYRTMDMISLEDFFAFELIQEFFAGPNPPNAIITGELPHDIASQRWNESNWLPYRRLLGTVLGAAAYDLQRPSELRFDIPAGMDIFREDGRVDIVDNEMFQDLLKEYANASHDNSTYPTLSQVTVFVDPFRSEAHLDNGRKLLQRGRGGRRGGGFGRAGAMRGGSIGRPRGSGRRWNGNTNNFYGGRNAYIGGFGGRGFVGASSLYPGYGGGGWGGLGYYGDAYSDPYVSSSRALAYQVPSTVVQQVPVPVPVPVPAPPPVMTAAILQNELTGTWSGNGGGAGMGSIRVLAVGSNGATQVTAQLPGCETCASGCRWKEATGLATFTSGGGSQLEVDFVSCDAQSTITMLRGSLEMAANGRNVIYWTPATHSTQWIRNA